MKLLVTGRSGSGKSTVCRELQRLGLAAFDGDKIPGLAGWVDAATLQPTVVDYSKPINRSTTLWFWNETTLRKLLTSHADIFLCGSADNALTFRGLFDKVFVLTLTPETQRQRILSRTEHDYGKLPAMQEQILREQAAFVRDALSVGATALDAEPAPAVIARKIMELTR